MDETYSKFIFLTTNVYDEMLSRFVDIDEDDFGTQITLENSEGLVIFDYFFKCSHCFEEIAFGFFSNDLFDENAYSKLVELTAILKSKITLASKANQSIHEIVHLCRLYKVECSNIEAFKIFNDRSLTV